ncbi:MAG: serine/threonine protein kinase [Fuerstiella sp.]|nr:serine/threonine protein kinase [Fuerstiella sp.]
MANDSEAEAGAVGRDVFRLSETDKTLAIHWKSGSLKYRDFKILREGGVARLYLCFDENLGRYVVYKTLHDHLVENEIEVQRFLREARITANISHPGTVPVYELGRDRNGNLFFTMERIRGRDLREILQALNSGDANTVRAFPISVLIDILIQVCRTLEHTHSRGVIHRDLKPANILTGEFGATYVIDWGLAKVWGEPDLNRPETGLYDKSELTPAGRRYGTPLYMAPELARGEAHIDARVDIFGLGSMLFEILTHRQLLSGENVTEVMENLLHKPFPSPRDIAPEKNIPPELDRICLKAIQKNRRNRYQTAESMMEDLQKFSHEENSFGFES